MRDKTPRSLEDAILSTLAYRDVFDFPLTLAEVHRFLHWHRCSLDDLAVTLEASSLCHDRVATDGRYFCFKGREAILSARQKRETRATEALARAKEVARQLAHFPHIRMIALTGSLAAQNCYEGSDIDLLCVTDEGVMWQSRAFVLAAQRFDAMTRNRRICLNFFMTTAGMEFEHHSMYIAQELAQMVPIYGRDIYDRMRLENDWSDEMLPNATGAPPLADDLAITVRPAIKVPLEQTARLLLSPWLESFERKRKLRRFNAPDFLGGTYSAYSADRTGHNMVTSQRIEAEWSRRAAAVVSHQKDAV